MADASPLLGRRAPAFTLADPAGDKRKLADFPGYRVLYFYPKADTPGCTTQACEFTESIDAFADLDASVIGISPDLPDALARFIAKHDLKVTLLSDPDHKVMDKYGAWGEKNMYGRKSVGVIRSTVLIDPAGKVIHHWRSVKTQGHAEKVRERLAELRG